MNLKATAIIVCVLLAFAAQQLLAQDVSVEMATEEPPYYVGVPAVVQLTVRGLEANPDPDCTVEVESNDVSAKLRSIKPSIIRQQFLSGGRLRRMEQVTHTIRFQVTAKKAGKYTVGPFRVKQNGTEKEVEAITMAFKDVPSTDKMRIKLKLPESAYPDQRVPVQIEWWFDGDVESVNSLNITAPVFDKFNFAPDEQAGRQESRIPIQTEAGPVTLAAEVRKETRDEKEFTVVSAQRTMIPDRPGNFEFEPASVTIEYVTQWARQRSPFDNMGIGGSLFDLESRRRPAKVEMYRVEGESVSFQVKPFPTQERPESFSGAVGTGFSLDVAAQRTVIRAGDPIRLTINLRGDGNIAGAKLPSLSADGGLDPEQFRLPEGEVAGVFDQGSKQFVVSVRVLDESISEIPAIAYSWFDPEKETYQTARSKPIALRVMPAQIVGADSVVSSQPIKELQSPNSPRTDPANALQARPFTLSGADLAIETDPGVLLSDSKSFLSRPSLQMTGYALGSAFLLVSIFDRRRRQADPAERERASMFRQQRNRISSAAKLPAREGAMEIAAALQAAQAKCNNENREATIEIIAQCEAVAYRPDGEQDTAIEKQLVDAALNAIDQLTNKKSPA